jgi:hypothetical protein
LPNPLEEGAHITSTCTSYSDSPCSSPKGSIDIYLKTHTLGKEKCSDYLEVVRYRVDITDNERLETYMIFLLE